jgi:hypothetical protein
MVIKTLEYPVYHQGRKGGLAGEGLKKGIPTKDFGKTFEEYLSDAFQGEKVQEGSWVSQNLTDLTKKNIRKINGFRG